MKNLLLFILSVFILSSCKKDDDGAAPLVKVTYKATCESGNYRVSYFDYIDGGFQLVHLDSLADNFVRDLYIPSNVLSKSSIAITAFNDGRGLDTAFVYILFNDSLYASDSARWPYTADAHYPSL